MSKSVTGTLELKIKFNNVPNDEVNPDSMSDIIDEMDYNFTARMGEATVTDTEVLSFVVTSVSDEVKPPFELTAKPNHAGWLKVFHLNSNRNSVDFSCRIWLDPEEIQVHVWVHELEVEGRFSKEWVQEEFSYLSLKEMYELFELPYNEDEPYESGKYQIIATGTVRGWKDQDTPNGPGEYDSELDINTKETAVWVPDPVAEDDQSNTVEQ